MQTKKLTTDRPKSMLKGLIGKREKSLRKRNSATPKLCTGFSIHEAKLCSQTTGNRLYGHKPLSLTWHFRSFSHPLLPSKHVTLYKGPLPCWHGTVLDRLRTCIGTRTCLSVNVPSGPLSLRPVRAPPAVPPAPCALGTARTVDESEESTKTSKTMFYTFQMSKICFEVGTASVMLQSKPTPSRLLSK